MDKKTIPCTWPPSECALYECRHTGKCAGEDQNILTSPKRYTTPNPDTKPIPKAQKKKSDD